VDTQAIQNQLTELDRQIELAKDKLKTLKRIRLNLTRGLEEARKLVTT
jgi:ribosomal protein L7/L12